jgi:CBS domain-containing protein
MKVGDVMTTSVVSVGPEASVLEAGELMLARDISGLPVIDAQGRLIGIVTERDFLRPPRARRGEQRPRWFQVMTGGATMQDGFNHRSGRKVDEVMTPAPITVTEDTPLDEAARLMHEHDVTRLPVVRGSKLVGIVARADLLRALIKAVHETTVAVEKDRELRAHLTEIERQSWLHRTRT